LAEQWALRGVKALGASWAWALGVKLCFSFFSLTMMLR
jgi:hypothetical protein